MLVYPHFITLVFGPNNPTTKLIAIFTPMNNPVEDLENRIYAYLRQQSELYGGCKFLIWHLSQTERMNKAELTDISRIIQQPLPGRSQI